jgi:hypothetical protein
MSKYDTNLDMLYDTAIEHGHAYASNRKWQATLGRWFFEGDGVPDTRGVKITHYDTDMIIIYPDRVVGLSHGLGSHSDRTGIDAILRGALRTERFTDIFQRMPSKLVCAYDGCVVEPKPDSTRCMFHSKYPEPEDLGPVSRWVPPLRVEDVTGIG